MLKARRLASFLASTGASTGTSRQVFARRGMLISDGFIAKEATDAPSRITAVEIRLAHAGAGVMRPAAANCLSFATLKAFFLTFAINYVEKVLRLHRRMGVLGGFRGFCTLAVSASGNNPRILFARR